MRRKMGWTAYGIVGFIFAPMGLLFVVIALLVGNMKTGWDSPESSLIFRAVFGGTGGLFLLLGLLFLGMDLRRRMLLRRAYDGGNCVEAKILSVTPRNNVHVNGSSPCVLECAWTAPDGVVHIYRSRYLYTDVSKLLTAETVPVYIDRYREDIGFVDVDAVLPEIRIHS